jgi:hypothetical protein
VQLPVNLEAREAFTGPTESGSTVLEVARSRSITVIGSAALMRARLARGVTPDVSVMIPGFDNAQRAIQFARSIPGVTCALVGSRTVRQVAQAVAVARAAPLDQGRFLAVADRHAGSVVTPAGAVLGGGSRRPGLGHALPPAAPCGTYVAGTTPSLPFW